MDATRSDVTRIAGLLAALLVAGCGTEAATPPDGGSVAEAGARPGTDGGGVAAGGDAALVGDAAPPGPGGALATQARDVLHQAITYCRTSLASHGGYVWLHLPDLSQSWGEGKVNADQIWVQPPGTPAVGLAYLASHAATGDPYYLESAQETGTALIYGQLVSGGWTANIDFDPQGAMVSLYRNGLGSGRNYTSFDDDTTQTALRFLMRLDERLGFADATVHDAVEYAAARVLAAQYPAGGFPQGFQAPVPAWPVLAASYPATWSRTKPPNLPYWDYYTINDNASGALSRMLVTAVRVYGETRYRDALTRLGDFLLLAQMPDPQPAWAQQYDEHMHPQWARKFEPPAVTGWESQDVLETLLAIHRETGDARYLAPVPRAIAYLRASLLPDGQLARFYELETNTPLYFTSDYVLTYSDADLPTHYGFKFPSRLDAIEQQYLAQAAGSRAPPPGPSSAELEAEVATIIDDLEPPGRWIDRGVKPRNFVPVGDYIYLETFNHNVQLLAQYLGWQP